MSALAEREHTRLCPGCGSEFIDRTHNGVRTYCETCRPPKGLRLVPSFIQPKIAGKPFTVPHFRRWSAKFTLKDGKPFKLESYQALFLDDLFARTNGQPIFEELWLVVPEGNGKTTFVALIVLYTIEFKGEAWVPVAASARDQAVDLTYRLCAGFVDRNERADYRLHPGYRSIVHRESKGAAKIFASDAASGDGVDPDLAVIEELHRLATMELYETWAGKLAKSGGQLLIVSTAGEPHGAFEKLRERIRQSANEITREGCFTRSVSTGTVLHEYALPEDGDPEDLELVAAANPFSGLTVAKLAKKRAKPSWNLEHWRRFTCNLPTRAGNAAIQEREWHDAATAEKPPQGVEEWLGLDVGWRWDTTAFVPLWWRDEHFRLLGPATILTPPQDGSSLSPDVLKHAFLEIVSVRNITTIVMDTHAAEDIAGWFSDELGLTVIERLQSNKPQAEDYRRFMEALRQGWLFHSGDEGLRRHAFNAVVKVLDAESVRFDRPAPNRKGGDQDVRVIDALRAASMVHSVRCEPPIVSDYGVAGFR